jgi:hypothetical protein
LIYVIKHPDAARSLFNRNRDLILGNRKANQRDSIWIIRLGFSNPATERVGARVLFLPSLIVVATLVKVIDEHDVAVCVAD